MKRRTMKFWEDFRIYTSGGELTSTLSGTTVAAGNSEGGVLAWTNDTTANHYGYVATTNAVFLIANNNPIYVEAWLNFTQQNVNQAAIMFGVSSAVGAGMIANTTGEPVASFSGAVIYCVPGSLFWNTKSSVGAVSPGKSISSTVAGNTSSTVYQRLSIGIEPVSSTIAEVTYYVNGLQLKVAGQVTPIKDQLTYTGAAAMQLFVGNKQISATNAENLNLDYLAGEQLCRLFAP